MQDLCWNVRDLIKIEEAFAETAGMRRGSRIAPANEWQDRRGLFVLKGGR